MSRYKTPKMRAYFRNRYHTKKEEFKATVYRYRERKLKIFFDTLETQGRLKCIKCQETHRACLDFHHRDAKDKIGTVMKMARLGNLQKAFIEAEKCDVLCSNCHRKLHHELRISLTRPLKRRDRL